jgi:hypothetical protein
MTLRLNGSTSGYTEIDAPAVAGSNTLVLPGGSGSADQVLATNGSGTLSFVDRGRMVLGTAQNSTSGTAIDFTGIPSWVKRITVIMQGVSTNGTSVVQVQLGTSSGFETSNYFTSASFISGANACGTAYITSGIGTTHANAAGSRSGQIVAISNPTNAWVYSGIVSDASNEATVHIGGAKNLSGTLDRIRITTVNGTDTFDAGSINILYEG